MSSESKEILALLKDARGIDRKLASLKDQKLALEREQNEKYAHMRRLVKSGASTGDPIRDYLLARYGHPDPVLERSYRKLNRHLAGKTGQLVAAFRYERVRRYGPRDEVRTEIRFYIGVLRDDKLRFVAVGTPLCSLPIDSYAVYMRHGTHHTIIRQPLCEGPAESFELLSGVAREHERPSAVYKIAVLAGDRAVRRLHKYEYLTLLPDDKEKVKRAEQAVGYLELEPGEA